MSCDPCAGHQCDGCDTCQSGICCQTLSAVSPTVVSPPDDLTVLREAIAEDNQGRPGLTDLIQAEAIRQILGDPLVSVPVPVVQASASAPDMRAAMKPGDRAALPPTSSSDLILRQTKPTERKDHVHNSRPRR
jgi:hypothetical protein